MSTMPVRTYLDRMAIGMSDVTPEGEIDFIVMPKFPPWAELINVFDFGAKGNGVTDDTSALQAAIAAMPPTGGVLLIPPGVYAYATTLNFIGTNARVSARGATLLFTGTGIAVTMNGGATAYYGGGIEGLIIKGQANCTKGLVLDNTHHGRFLNVVVQDVNGIAFEITNSICNYFKNLRCSGNEQGTWGTQPVTGLKLIGWNCSANTFVNTIMEGVSGDGILFDGATRNTFLGGTSEGCARGITLPADSDYNTFQNIDCEANTVSDFDIAASYTTLTNCLGASLVALGGLRITAGVNNVVINGMFHNIAITTPALGTTLLNAAYSLLASPVGTYTNTDPSSKAIGIVNNQTAEIFDNLRLSNPAVFSVYDFGAKGDGVTDDTAAIQSTIAKALAAPEGGTVLFPPGIYNTTSLDLHNEGAALGKSIRLVGTGRYSSVIKGTQNGGILIDALGRCYLSLEDIRLTTDGTAVYQTAVLLARRTGGSAFCRNGIFSRVTIWGDFSVASAVAIASEINTWDDCELVNEDPTNNYCCFFTSLNNDLAGITSTHGTILASIANTCNVMRHVVWYAPYVGATPVIMHAGAQYNMIGCTVQCDTATGTGIKCVTYIEDGTGPGGGFLGPVNWIGTLWEIKQGVVHYFDTQAGTVGYFNSISDVGGAFTLGGAGASNYAMQTAGNPGCLVTCRLEDVRYYGGAASTLSIEADYVAGCRLDIWNPAFDTTITVNTGRTSSFLRAKTLDIPPTDVGFAGFPATVLTEKPYAEVSHAHDARYAELGKLAAGVVPYQPLTEKLLDGGLELWTTATNLTYWTEAISGASTVNRESTEKHGGTYACRLDIDASNNYARIALSPTLAPETPYRLTLWTKSATGKDASFLVQDDSGNVYLQADGSWSSTPGGIGLVGTGAWVKTEIQFVTPATYTVYAFYIGAGINWSEATSGSVYLDDLSIMATGFADSPISYHGTTPNISALPSYTSDALAGAAGLVTGDLYTVSGTSPLQLAVKT